MGKEQLASYEGIPPRVVEIINHDAFLLSLPRIDNLTPVVGGVAHDVYQVISSGENFYLKIRDTRFSQIPEISCDPAEIVFEYQALTLFKCLAPENFPYVLSFNPEQFYLVLSDAISDGKKLEDLFLEEMVIPEMLFVFGKTLKKIHKLSQQHQEGLRPDGDKAHYEAKLQHRLGYRHSQVLDGVIEALRCQKDKQLILGDVAPKNIGVNDSGRQFIFFDLEDAHLGDVIFDYAYFLGHLLIHTFTSPSISVKAIENYEKGYDGDNFDQALVKKIVLGIMLYRLGGIIPYATNLDANQKIAVEKNVETLLSEDLVNTTWSEIIEAINHGQN